MEMVTIELPADLVAQMDVLAAKMNVDRLTYLRNTLKRHLLLQQAKAGRDTDLTEQYNQIADLPEMQLSDAEKARSYARLRELEW
jgi:hypothetical protein